MMADRSPEDEDFASQSMLSRFENFVTPRSLPWLEEWFLDRFVNLFEEPRHAPRL